MKFVVIKQNMGENSCQLFPFIFSQQMSHKQASEHFRSSLRHQFRLSNEVVSAGFVHAGSDNYHGESVTLNIKCHPKTQEVLSMIDYIQIFDKDNCPLEAIKIN